MCTFIERRWHRLRETIERYVILSGTGIVEIGDTPARTVTTGDVVMIPAHCPQRIHNSGSADLIFLAICTPPFVVGNYEDIDSASLPSTPLREREDAAG